MNRIAYGLYPAASTEPAVRGKDRLGQLFFALIFVTLLWPDYAELKFAGVPNLAFPRLFRAATILYAIFVLFRDRERYAMFTRRLSENWVSIGILMAFFTFRLGTNFISTAPVLQFVIFVKYDVWSYLSMFFLALLILRDRHDVKKFMMLVVGTGAIAGALAVLEFRLKHNLFQGIVTVTSDFVLAALRDKTRDNFYRAESTFEHPIILGEFYALILPWCYYFFRYAPIRWQRMLAASTGFLGMLAIYVSGSRSAFAVAIPVFILMLGWEIWLWTKSSVNRPAQYLVLLQFPMAAGALGVIVLFLKSIASGTTQETRSSASVRLEMLSAGINKIAESIFVGYGQGEASNQVVFIGTGGVRTLDNLYLAIGLESGLLGLALMVICWLTFLGIAISLMNDKNADRSRLGVLLTLSMASYIIIAAIHSLQSLTWVFYMLCACALILREQKRRDQ